MTALVAAVICLLVYLRALTCGFVNLDDPFLVVNNPVIRNLDRTLLVWAFSAPQFELWMPLTWISLALDYRLWQLNPFGYHLTNIILHSINTALVVLIADRLLRQVPAGKYGRERVTGALLWLPLLAGLIFGLHPMRVESVAWVTERKDVLNGLFSLSALLCYLDFTADREGKRWRKYLLSFAFFLLSFGAKSISIVIPLLLLLLDRYPLGRLRRETYRGVLLEKLPYVAISVIMAAATVYFSVRNHLTAGLGVLPLLERVLISGNAVFEYCRLLIWPVGILPFYPLPAEIPGYYFLTTAVILLLTLVALASAARYPAASTTWFCFLIPLLPVLAFIQSGDQELSPHLTYLPSVIPSITAAALLSAAGERIRRPGIVPRLHPLLPVVLLLLLYAGMTVRLIGVWQDTGSFWSRVIDQRPNARAYADRGVFYLINGNSAAALADFSRVLDSAGNHTRRLRYNLHAFRGVALKDLGQFAGAVAEFDRAIALNPLPTYFRERGDAHTALGQREEAERDYRLAGPNPPPIDWF
jgi:hypothetical protein